MSIGWKIAIGVLTLVLLYILWKYVFAVKPIEPITVVNTPRGTPVNINIHTQDAKCGELEKLKINIDDFWKRFDQTNTDVINGFAISHGGNITDAAILKQRFDEAQYNYNNEIIKYNSIIESGKCGSTPKQEPKVAFTTSARFVDKDLLDCNGTGYKRQLTLLAIDYKTAETNYQLAYINNKNYDVSETRQKLEEATKKFNVATAKFNEFNNLCNNKK